MSGQYDRFAWHYYEAEMGDPYLRIQRVGWDRFVYHVEMYNGDRWCWVADVASYSPTNVRVLEGRLTEEQVFTVAGMCHEEYRSRPIEEK